MREQLAELAGRAQRHRKTLALAPFEETRIQWLRLRGDGVAQRLEQAAQRTVTACGSIRRLQNSTSKSFNASRDEGISGNLVSCMACSNIARSR